MGLLEPVLEPLKCGDQESPLRWSCEGTRSLAGEPVHHRHRISHRGVAQHPRRLDYSLPGNRKRKDQGEDHPDQDAQLVSWWNHWPGRAAQLWMVKPIGKRSPRSGA